MQKGHVALNYACSFVFRGCIGSTLDVLTQAMITNPLSFFTREILHVFFITKSFNLISMFFH